MSAMGAVHLLVPGPKMIYHFGALGYSSSIFTCNNGTVNNPNCKLDTKPQPQWTENWMEVPARKKIYDDWAKMIGLRKSENVFENGTHSWNFSQTGKTRLDISTSTTQTANLSYVFVLTNMTNSVSNSAGNFPFPGVWYNLMDGTSINVTDVTMPISIEVDGFRVFGNKQSTLNNDQFEVMANVSLYPNPSSNYFSINTATSKVEVYSLTGQLVKSFDTVANEDHQYNVSDLNNGLYLVKVTDINNREKTMKFIKQ